VEQQTEGKSIKADEKCKGLLDRFVVAALGTNDPAEESAASSTQVVNSSYVCPVHNEFDVSYTKPQVL